MADLPTLLDRNRSFAERFTGGDLKIRPRLSTLILSCVDARVDPAHLFDLKIGDAVVLRNAGGRITPAVMKDLAILGVLNANLPGAAPAALEFIVIHHVDCGMARLADPEIQQQVAQRLGLQNEEVAAMAVTDPAATVQVDIERLRQTPGAPGALVVAGLVYDPHNGTIDTVVPPAPLRAAG